jgi:hypothetical protein
MSYWIAGAVSGLFGLLGLFLASRAVDDGMYVFGFALLAFGILMVFSMMKQAFDASEVAAVAPEMAPPAKLAAE